MRILPGVPDALRALKTAGFLLLVISNQSAVARGLARPEQVRMVQARIQDLLSAHGVSIDGFYYCFHHPSEGDERWRMRCYCRKPEPGLFIRAAAEHGASLGESFAIGNMWSDVVAANRAGLRSIFVRTTVVKALEDPMANSPEARPWAEADDLPAAAELVLAQLGRETGVANGARMARREGSQR